MRLNRIIVCCFVTACMLSVNGETQSETHAGFQLEYGAAVYACA